MTTLFRHNVAPEGQSAENGFSLLLSLLDPRSGRQKTVTKIDQALLNWSIHQRADLKQYNLDGRVIDVFLDEVTKHGPPRGIDLDLTAVQLDSRPFSARWGDFSLGQSEDHFALSFVEPESHRRCEFGLVPVGLPAGARMSVEAARDVGRPQQGMEYFTYPRLRLAGQVDDAAVTGQAWLDHQWGDYSWILTAPSPGRVLGWDWFGINLDDGSDLDCDGA